MLLSHSSRAPDGSQRVAEIGVDSGQNAYQLMTANPTLRMLLVDNHRDFKGRDHYLHKLSALHKNMWPLRSRATFVSQNAEDAAAVVAPGVFDLIFFDCIKERPLRDIMRAWWPTLGHGSIIAGHGWLDGDVVLEAHEFAGEVGMVLVLGLDVWYMLTADKFESLFGGLF